MVEVHAGCRFESVSVVCDEVTPAARLCTRSAHVTCNGRRDVQHRAGCSVSPSPHHTVSSRNVYITVKAKKSKYFHGQQDCSVCKKWPELKGSNKTIWNLWKC